MMHYRNNRKRTKKGKLLFSFIILLLIIVGGFFFFNHFKKASAEWFDSSWFYRKAITAVNASPYNATNIPYKYVLDTSTLISAGKMQATGNDIRIIDSSGKIVRSQVEKSTLNTTTTGIWFEASVAASSSATYYVYYGNPSATSPGFRSDVRTVTDNGAEVEMLDGYGYSTQSTSHAKISDIRKNGTNLGVNGCFHESDGYPSWWDDRAFTKTLLASGPLFVEVKFEDTNYGVYSSFGNIIKMFSNGYVSERVYMNYNTSGTEDLYYYLHFDNGTRNSVWVNSSGALVDQAPNSPTLYEADLRDNWFGQRWTTSGNYGGTIITKNGSDWYYGGTSAQNSYYQVNYSFSSAYTAGSSRQINYGTFAGNGSLEEMHQKGSLYGAYSTTGGSEEKGPAPVAYWKFDEGTGTTTYDDSTNNFDGAISSSAWQTEDQCVSGKCLKFSTFSSDYVRTPVPSNSILNFGSGDFTISGWIKAFQPPDYGYSIFGNYPHAGQNGDLVIGIADDTTSLFLAHRNASGQAEAYMYGFSSYFGKWTHISWVKSGSTLYLYINGVQKYSVNPGITFDVRFQQSGDQYYYISNGGWYHTSVSLFVDDHKIYNYARTASQIKADYNAGKSGAGGSAKSASMGNKTQDWMSNGLVGYWKMDEASWNGTSGEVIDSSGNANNGTSYNAANTGAAKFGNGGVFDGTNDEVAIPDSSNLKYTGGNFTISAWTKPLLSDATDGYIISKPWNGMGYYNYWMKWTSVDKVLAGVGSAATGADEYTVTTDAAYSENVWHHVVITFGNDKSVKIYVDGVLSKSGTHSITDWTPGTPGDSNLRLAISNLYPQEPAQSQWIYGGSTDEVRIYNRVLSAKEVSDLYNWAPGPVGHWKMDDKISGNSKTVVDSSGSGNNGTTYYGANVSGMDCTKVGKYGGACSFDGVDDYINVGNNTSLQVVSAFTAEFWVMLTRTGNYEYIVTKGGANGSGNDGWWIQKDINSTNIGPGINNSSSYWEGARTSVPLNTLTHIAITYDAGTVKTYKNGVLSITSTSAPTSIAGPAARNMVFGTHPNGTSYPFAGTLDDIRIYNYARTQKQILEDMNAGHPSVGSPVGSYAGYWKFDEGAGTTAKDQSVNANNGTISGAAWTNNGKFGKALSFNGTNNYVRIAQNNSLQLGTGSISVSAWVNPSSFASYKQIFSGGGSGGGYGYGVILDSTGRVVYEIYGSTGGRQQKYTSVAVPLKSWSHIVVTYDRDTQNFLLYVNGALRNSSTITDPGTVTNPNNFYIGSYYTGSDWLFDGLIDEVKVYQFALTAADVKAEYNQGKSIVMGSLSNTSGLTGGSVASNSASAAYCIPGDTATCNPPVGEWKFDENVSGNSQTVYDTSGNGNNGTTYYGANASGMDCTVLGKYATGCSFDGVDDYVNAGSGASLPTAGNITIEAWIFPRDVGSPGNVKMIWSRGSYVFAIEDGKLVFQRPEPWDTIYGTKVLQIGHWYHVVFTKAGANSGDSKIYVNGEQGDSAAAISNLTMSDPLWIGQQSVAGIRPFNGIIDDVKIFNYARTPAQIVWDYNRGGPVGYWKMNECQGSTLTDSSGNGNNGTITIGASGTQDGIGTCTDGDTTNAWYNGRNGKYNSAISFDGVDDYVDMGQPSSLNFTGAQPFTIEAWINTDDHLQDQAIVSKASSFWTNHQYVFNIENDIGGKLSFTYGPSYGCNGSTVITDNVWHHVVILSDGSIMKIYLDGKQDGSNCTAYSLTTQAQPFIVGDVAIHYPRPSVGWEGSDGRVQEFNGLIDDVKIYNYALTAQQIKLEYNQGAAVRFAPITGRP